MTLLVAALLGVVQGLTEFLPVSSTAHLLIGARLLGFDDPGGVFTVMIQLGSILAVDVAVSREDPRRARRACRPTRTRGTSRSMILVAFLPALVAGALFVELREARALRRASTVIAVAFIVGGIVMLVVERFRPAPDVLDADSTPLGARARRSASCQALALVPGVSRSGAHDRRRRC